jgi:ribosome-associated protein
VRDAVKSRGLPLMSIEGEDNGEWIIVDCGAAVAHIMQPAIRQYYNLEEIWGGKAVNMKLGAAAGFPARAKASEQDAAPAAGAADVQATAVRKTTRGTGSGKVASKAGASGASRRASTTNAKSPRSTGRSAKPSPSRSGTASTTSTRSTKTTSASRRANPAGPATGAARKAGKPAAKPARAGAAKTKQGAATTRRKA